MFKKSRRKIVAAIMSVLVLVWAGTLGVIYGSSYYEVSAHNREMLSRNAQLYHLEYSPEESGYFSQEAADSGSFSKEAADSGPFFQEDGPKQDPAPPRPENTPAFQLSTFYSVAVSRDGQALKTNNPKTALYTSQELEEAAFEAIRSEKKSGTIGTLLYQVEDKGFYTLVAFMDNTIVRESMTTLFRYTLIFGGLAILILFFLAVLLARQIVKPLEESYRKQQQFISDAGHELKTPVSVVSANAELLSRELGENQWLANIQYENARMSALITQLLDLARTESAAPQKETLDFSRLVRGEALPFESMIFEKGISFTCRITEHLYVNGSSMQLKQLVSILLDNAFEHCGSKKEISLTLKNQKHFASLTVSNDGPMIPSQQLEQLFQRFYRLDPSRSGEDTHYGLGLAIAKAIAEAHGGRIEVACADGRVKFTVQIPLLKESSIQLQSSFPTIQTVTSQHHSTRKGRDKNKRSKLPK